MLVCGFTELEFRICRFGVWRFIVDSSRSVRSGCRV